MAPTKTKKSPLPVLALLVLLGAAAAFFLLRPEQSHSRTVAVEDGSGTIWIEPIRDLPASALSGEQFTRQDGAIVYTGSEFIARQGVDVSDWQQSIRWEEVADSGIDFAVIRCGFRRYATGEVETDGFFEANYTGAGSAGLRRGVYFFSQAISVEEAQEEAAYVLRLLNSRSLELPVFFDWETVGAAEGRANGLDAATVTACAAAFCQAIEDGGYTAGIYFNLQMGYHTYDLSQFTDRTLWLAEPGEQPTFYYQTALWQYDHSGTVPGIDTAADRNLLFEPVVQASGSGS